MALVVVKKQYELMTEGIHNITITQVQDLGLVDTKNGVKDRLRIILTADDQKAKDGSRVDTQLTFTKSLGPKSNLRKFLVQLGFNPGVEFDMDSLIGLKAQVLIEHNDYEGTTYANVQAVLKRSRSTTAAPAPEAVQEV
jgi:hypothetical protein